MHWYWVSYRLDLSGVRPFNKMKPWFRMHCFWIRKGSASMQRYKPLSHCAVTCSWITVNCRYNKQPHCTVRNPLPPSTNHNPLLVFLRLLCAFDLRSSPQRLRPVLALFACTVKHIYQPHIASRKGGPESALTYVVACLLSQSWSPDRFVPACNAAQISWELLPSRRSERSLCSFHHRTVFEIQTPRPGPCLLCTIRRVWIEARPSWHWRDSGAEHHCDKPRLGTGHLSVHMSSGFDALTRPFACGQGGGYGWTCAYAVWLAAHGRPYLLNRRLVRLSMEGIYCLLCLPCMEVDRGMSLSLELMFSP